MTSKTQFERLETSEQEKLFKQLTTQFTDILEGCRSGPDKIVGQIKPEWDEIINKLYSLYRGTLPLDFLHNSVVTHALFMNSQGDLMHHQLGLCQKYFTPEELKTVLAESPIGRPPRAFVPDHKTSHNVIHHLYHIARYERRTKKKVATAKRVLEWGGGYGNLCKVIAALPESSLETYTIVDIPEITALQWVYLSSIFGFERVNLVQKGTAVQEGKINLVSLPNLSLLDNDYDLFVSTWALSESPVASHEFVNNKKWFNAEHLLMAIHQCGDHIPFMKESTNVGLLAKKFGAYIEDVQVIPGTNYYIFK